jgi:hypothetical protein
MSTGIDNYRFFVKMYLDLIDEAEEDPERFRAAFEEMNIQLP